MFCWLHRNTSTEVRSTATRDTVPKAKCALLSVSCTDPFCLKSSTARHIAVRSRLPWIQIGPKPKPQRSLPSPLETGFPGELVERLERRVRGMDRCRAPEALHLRRNAR